MKEYSVYVKYEVDIHEVEASNMKNCIKKVQSVFKEEHNINLRENEIQITGVR